MNKILTLSEALKNANSNLYYRISGYNRSLALTEFLKDLEEDFGNQFELTSACIINLHARDENGEIKNIPAKASVSRYASFILNNTDYYIQYDDNYFFEAYIALKNNEKRKIEKRIDIFDDVDFEILCNYNEGESIQFLKTYLYNKFLKVRKDNYNIDTITPKAQKIYYRG